MNISKQQKQVVMLYASSALGVLVGVLNSVLNTRSLAPELYGNVRYVQNLISFVSSLLLVGYFTSGSRLLALSRDEQASRRIRGIMCVILAATIAVVMLTMAVMAVYTRLCNAQSGMLSLYLIAIPFCGTTLLLNYANTTAQGDNHIGRMAVARLLPSALYFVVAWLVFHYCGATPERMLGLFNGIATVVLLAVILSTRPSFEGLRESFATLHEENRHYGFNVYLGALANVSTGYVAGITLGAFCENNANVGFYTLACTMAAPLAMLPSIIGTTYFKRFATEKAISPKILWSSVGLTAVSCLAFIVLIKYLVQLLYNEDYQCVAGYASWLVFGTCMQGLGDMFNRFLGAHGLGRQIRNGAFAAGGVLLVGSIVLVYFFQIEGAVATKIASALVYLAAMCYYYVKFVKKEKTENVDHTAVG